MDTVVVSHVGYMFGECRLLVLHSTTLLSLSLLVPSEMASMTRNTIISSLNGVPTPNIDICAQVLSGIPDGAYVSVSMNHVVGRWPCFHRPPRALHAFLSADQRYHYKDVICMDRRFFSMSMFKRDLLADIQREDIMSEVYDLTISCDLLLLVASECVCVCMCACVSSWSRYNYPPPPPPASRVGEPTTTALEVIWRCISNRYVILTSRCVLFPGSLRLYQERCEVLSASKFSSGFPIGRFHPQTIPGCRHHHRQAKVRGVAVGLCVLTPLSLFPFGAEDLCLLTGPAVPS